MKYREIYWTVRTRVSNRLISSGVFRNRTIQEVYEFLKYFGYTEPKWYEFWKPKIILTKQQWEKNMKILKMTRIFLIVLAVWVIITPLITLSSLICGVLWLTSPVEIFKDTVEELSIDRFWNMKTLMKDIRIELEWNY